MQGETVAKLNAHILNGRATIGRRRSHSVVQALPQHYGEKADTHPVQRGIHSVRLARCSVGTVGYIVVISVYGLGVRARDSFAVSIASRGSRFAIQIEGSSPEWSRT